MSGHLDHIAVADEIASLHRDPASSVTEEGSAAWSTRVQRLLPLLVDWRRSLALQAGCSPFGSPVSGA